MSERHADVLIVGGGTGGCAAALAACSLGRRVVMTEETDWIGGQLTSQCVPPDENRWIEQFGCTRRYRAFRDGVRRYYRDHYPLLPEARDNRRLNPGGGGVSRICHEPRVGLAVLEAMLARYRSAGLLETLLWRRPVGADVQGDTVRAVTLRHLHTGAEETIRAPYVLDATELGDLLPLAGAEYVSGAESRSETGEPRALDGPADPDDVQAITWCFVMSYDPKGDHTIDRPPFYDRWRDYAPKLEPAWPGRMLSWETTHPVWMRPMTWLLFRQEDTPRDTPAGWQFRKIISRQHYSPEAMPFEATLVNWPQIDYVERNIIDAPQDDVAAGLREAREQSIAFFYWMQTEAPRPDGGVGYPGLFLRPDIVGTDDGLAKYAYIRESRRIRALFTVTENHVGVDARGRGKAAEPFADSVGIGHYNIDLHPSTGKRNYVDIPSYPFQIPLGALVPIRMENLLPACKNLGVTHITNGCYRLHPVEWNIGEAAGLLAAFCAALKVRPRQVHRTPALLDDFQRVVDAQGIERAWPDVRV